MDKCGDSSWQDLTIGEFLIISLQLLLIIGVYALIGICLLWIAKFMIRWMSFGIRWIFSKKFRYYQSIIKSRKDYTRQQFIRDCENEGIDPFVAKVFWNFCYKYYPYKPHLDDGLDISGKKTLQFAIINTIDISGYKSEIDITKLTNIKDVLLLLSK